MSKAGIGIGTFVLGACAGFVVGLLYAPRAGVETRALVSEKVDEYWGQGQELYARGVERVQSGYTAATEKASDLTSRVKPYVDDRSDELRARIEEARERIAAEVSKNASTVHDAVAERIPAAASKVDELADSAEAAAQRAADFIAPSVEAVEEAAE